MKVLVGADGPVERRGRPEEMQNRMNAQPLTGVLPTDGVPSQKLLEGFTRLYQFVLVLDSDGHIVWLSNEMGAMCSINAGHVGQDARAIFPEASKFRREFAIRSQIRKQGFLSNMRIDVRDNRGELVPVELSILPIGVDDVDKPLYVAIARPVEDETPVEEASASDAQLFAAILDGAPEAVLAVNERGFISYANPEVERLVGRSPESLADQPVAKLLSDTNEIERLVSSLAPGEGIRDEGLSLQHADGHTVHVSASASALGVSNGSPRGTVLFLRDVTERRGTEEALARKNVELEHCVHSLSHDLRSPLVALLGFSRLLRQDYGEQMDDTGRHFIDRIEQAGRTMEELIRDLLEFSRIGQGGERRALVDPRIVLLQIAAEMKPRLEAIGARLEIPEQPPLVFCDRTRLYQVFSNLVGNAVDHMGPCDDAVVSVEVWNDRDGHHLVVRDRGRGIPPADHERIFEVFQSLGPGSDGRRGSGIGLAIVKKIAETHGGRVWVEGSQKPGASFRLTFPRR
jgi:PAS domain S-box-containing protein